MKFIVDLDTSLGPDGDRVDPCALEAAIEEALQTLKLPNGDTLYFFEGAVSVKFESYS